jgi:signal transduction histidine kinase/ActR/RegA family two-component response regulator
MTMTGNGSHGAGCDIAPVRSLPPVVAAGRNGIAPGRIAAAIVASAEPATVLRALLEAVRTTTGADRVLLVDPHRDGSGTADPSPPVDDVLRPLATLPDAAAAYIERAVTTGEVVSEGAGTEWIAGDAASAATAHEVLCVPATAFGTVQAVLYLERRVEDGAPLADGVETLEEAMPYLALCVLHRRSAGSAEAARRRAAHEASVHRIDAVATLAGGIAHDFNNHLTVINGLCDLLLDDARLAPVIRTDLNEIRAAGEGAAVLTNQLLSYSGRQILQPAPADLNRVLRFAEGKLRRTLGESIDLAFDLAPGFGWAVLDEAQIEQVLLNLAANARDAMRGGGGVLIRTRNVDLGAELRDALPPLEPGAYVCASVSDTGPGIPADVLPRIFEPFFTTAAPGQRMGLGLPTAYGILRQLGGGIAIERVEGRGATFTIYVRRTAAPTSGDDAAAGPEGCGGERILIVEDRDDVRRLATQVLSKHGYEVLAAADGPTALQVAADVPGAIDLLVTDVVMPGMNGGELAKALTAARPGLKVLFTSGYTADKIGACGVLEEGTAYLRKPFSPRQLRARVREILDERDPASAPPDSH